MTRGLPPTGRAAAENELLARLGLPPSAAPEDVDNLHLAVSEYLAAAPASIRGWAHAQATALDAAYLQLTDPVGLEGSALKSPTRPPRVDPGGPATPPARRDFSPPADPLPGDYDLTADVPADENEDDAEALYASVTPSAHRDTGPDKRSKARRARPLPGAVIVASQGQSDGGPWKKIVIGGVGIVVAAVVLVGVYNLGASGTSPGGTGGTGGTVQASPSAPAIDMALVASLMAKIQANPNDVPSLLALANEYYAGGQYDVSAQWLDKVLAIDPKNIDALLARGAVSFNLGDLTAAQATWQQVVAIDPNNVEVHYDLGFLYLNQPSPNWTGVQTEWNKVIQLGPGTSLAQTVQSHLDSLAASSMIPATSGSPAGSPAASSSPAASGSPAAPSASPAASPTP